MNHGISAQQKALDVMHHFMGHTLKLILIFCLTFPACDTSSKKELPKNSTVDKVQQSPTTKLSPIDMDTLEIDTKCAVFFQPDSLQIEKQMKRTNEQDFRAGADDYIYYINISAEYLEKQGLKVVDAKNKKYIRFVSTDNKMQLVKLDTLEDLWGMFLFDPTKKAYYVDISDIEGEYEKYNKQ